MNEGFKFHEQWKRHREKVHELRTSYEGRIRALEGYQGSPRYDEDAKQAEKAFNEGLEALRAESQPIFADILADLEKSVVAESMDAPSPEQLALLQMLSLRSSVESQELEQAAKTLRSNDAAMRTLQDIAAQLGRVLPASYQSQEQQRRYIVGELRRAVGGLMAWDGRSREQVMSDYLMQRHEFKFNGGELPSRTMTASSDVADLEAGSYAAETMRAILPDADASVIADFLDV